MKCVKNIESAEIRRVSEQIAENLVNTSKWKYIPKSEWKPTRQVPAASIVPEVSSEHKQTQEEKKIRQKTKKDAYREAKRLSRVAQKEKK